jgi:putative CocE/NonD family hydrolase
VVAADDIYRDTAFAGGFQDTEFDDFFLGLTGSLNLINPALQGSPDLAGSLSRNVGDLASFQAALTTEIETGGHEAYDEAYWAARNPIGHIQQIVGNHIPAFLVGGWFDLFQRGELHNYSAFQNAYDHRALLAPMGAGQPVTPRYQLLQGPWFHSNTTTGPAYRGLDLEGLQLAWFDHWLKGRGTGITATRTPMHLYDLGTGHWREAARFPLEQATPGRYFLGAGGALSTTGPPAVSAPDTLAFTGSQIPCTTSTDQWIAGLPTVAVAMFGLSNPCNRDASTSQLGPGTRNYTTAPFTTPMALAGPIAATLYASATTTDTEWVVQISDVAPDGSARVLTSGLLEGNQRATDPATSWTAPDGQPLLPFHPYTRSAQQPVIRGQVTRYQIEVFPTVDTIQPRHRLRVTIATSDVPHALPTVAQLPNLIGGIYTLQHNGAYPSSVELPLASIGAFEPPAEPSARTKARPSCRASRVVLLNLIRSGRLHSVRVTVNGRRVHARLVGARSVRVRLAGSSSATYVVKARARATRHRQHTRTWTFRLCARAPA